MTNQEKLDQAVKFLREVGVSIDQERGANIIQYSEHLPSFSELVEEIAIVKLID